MKLFLIWSFRLVSAPISLHWMWTTNNPEFQTTTYSQNEEDGRVQFVKKKATEMCHDWSVTLEHLTHSEWQSLFTLLCPTNCSFSPPCASVHGIIRMLSCVVITQDSLIFSFIPSFWTLPLLLLLFFPTITTLPLVYVLFLTLSTSLLSSILVVLPFPFLLQVQWGRCPMELHPRYGDECLVSVCGEAGNCRPGQVHATSQMLTSRHSP